MSVHFEPLSPKVYAPVFVLMLLLIAALGFYTWSEHRIIKDTEDRAAVALRDFMSGSGDKASRSNGVDVYLQNVRFYWSSKIHLDANHLNAKAIPVNKNGVVDFDNPNSFMINLGQSDIALTPAVLGGMFNEGVFNYPGSKLRDLNVDVVNDQGSNRIKLSGSINYLFWIPFEMIANLTVDRRTNTLVMTVEDLHIFKFIPVHPLIRFHPFTMERILTLPANKQLDIERNRILIKPFGLFPPPRVTGEFRNITVSTHPKRIIIAFSSPNGVNESLGRNERGNLILLKSGRSQFVNMIMRNTNVRVEDANPKTAFYFSLPTYRTELPKSKIHMNGDHSLDVVMPDAAHTKS